MSAGQTRMLPGLPKQRTVELDAVLTSLSDEEFKALELMYSKEFKNPADAFVLALTLGFLGVDRFYLGQPMLGLAKGLVGLVGVASGVVLVLSALSGLNAPLALDPVVETVCLATVPIIFLWWLIDLSLSPHVARKSNERLAIDLALKVKQMVAAGINFDALASVQEAKEPILLTILKIACAVVVFFALVAILISRL